MPDKVADKMIMDNYESFINDLDQLIAGNESIPIILVKSSILRLLENRLLEDGYNVINNGLLIPFPLHYHIKTFHERVKQLMAKNR